MSKRTHSELLKDRSHELGLAQLANNKLMQWAFNARKLDQNLAVLNTGIGKIKHHHRQDVQIVDCSHDQFETKLEQQVASAQARLNTLRPQLALAEKDLESDRKEEERLARHLKTLRAKADKLTDEARESSQLELDAHQARSHTETEIRSLEIENDFLEHQLADSKRLTQGANRTAREEDNKAKKAERDLADLKARIKKQKRDLETKLLLAQKNSEELEDRLRREYKASLDSQVRAFEKEEDTRNNRKRKELKAAADEEYTNHCDAMKDAVANNDRLRQQIVTTDLDISKLEARNKADSNVEISTNKLATTLADELAALAAKHESARASEDREMFELTDDIAIKKREYDELMTVKNALNMEIKAYRLLLENEEDRLGPEQQPKKRAKVSQASDEEEDDVDMDEDADDKPAPPATRTRSRRLTRSSSSRQ